MLKMHNSVNIICGCKLKLQGFNYLGIKFNRKLFNDFVSTAQIMWKRDLRFSWRWRFKSRSSELWCRVVLW